MVFKNLQANVVRNERGPSLIVVVMCLGRVKLEKQESGLAVLEVAVVIAGVRHSILHDGLNKDKKSKIK